MLPVINQLKPDEIVAKSSFKPFDNIKIKNKTKRPLGFPCSTAARVTAGVQFRSLAWDLPHAGGMAKKICQKKPVNIYIVIHSKWLKKKKSQNIVYNS